MKAVVIGAYGHIGTYLVPMLIEQGYEVLAVSRGISKPYEENPLWEQAVKVKLDRTKAPGFSQAIADMQAEVVIDLINFDIRESQAMVRALKGTNCTHYLYCSSCWAHGRACLLYTSRERRIIHFPEKIRLFHKDNASHG